MTAWKMADGKWQMAKGIWQMVFLTFAICHLPCRSIAAPSELKRANRLFVDGDYERALKAYNDALVDQPHSSILHFNAGDAAYQMGDFGKAAKEFEEASQSAIPRLKAAAQYNRGNALFRQQAWGEAVEAYKQTLRTDPGDEDAKYNLGIALRALKNPPKSQPKGGGQSPKTPKGGGQTEPKQGQGQSSPSTGMSREDAERLLSAAGSGEQKKTGQKMPKGEIPHPDEDW
jgi:Ca-activated chloride channel family protein